MGMFPTRFKSALSSTYVNLDNNPANTKLIFTNSQIIFPENFNIRYKDVGLRNEMNYTLEVINNTNINSRYKIKIDHGNPISLRIEKREEWKLKWVHGMCWIQKPKNIGIVIAMITAIATILRLTLH
jgi:hypothetical protein